jgi:hypothetical protein
VTAHEVVALYGNLISLGTLAQWRYRKMGPSFLKKGHLVYYPAADLLAWETQRGYMASAQAELQRLVEGHARSLPRNQ